MSPSRACGRAGTSTDISSFHNWTVNAAGTHGQDLKELSGLILVVAQVVGPTPNFPATPHCTAGINNSGDVDGIHERGRIDRTMPTSFEQ